MTRVLHLLDEPPGLSAALPMRLSADVMRLEAGPEEQHAWLLIGGEPMRAAARAAGIDDTRIRLMPRPAGVRRLVPGAMREMTSLMRQADSVACWTVGAATLATRLGCQSSVPRFGQATLCGYARRAIDASGDRGAPASYRTGRSAALSDPGEPTGLAPLGVDQQRQSIRGRWGIDDDTFIVALLADHPEQVDTREAFMAVAFTFETLAAAKAERGDVRLLCHPKSMRRADANRLAELLGQPQLVLQDARALSPWAVLLGCDIALAPDPLNAGLSILWANAMGVPLIAPPESRLPMLAELEHIQTCQSSSAKHVAHPLTRWVFDRQAVSRRCQQAGLSH